MDCLVTDAANHKGLASAHRHEPDPCRSLTLSWSVEIRELADVVDFDALRRFADLAASSEQSVDQLVAPDCGQVRRLIVEGCCLLPVKWDAAESGDQWFLPAVAVNHDLEARSRSIYSRSFGLVFAGHLRHRGAVLACQCLQHRRLHHPAKFPEFVDVCGEEIVLDVPSVFGPILTDDGEVVVVKHLGSLRGLAALHVEGAF